jgi:hypothetical protein
VEVSSPFSSCADELTVDDSLKRAWLVLASNGVGAVILDFRMCLAEEILTCLRMRQRDTMLKARWRDHSRSTQHTGRMALEHTTRLGGLVTPQRLTGLRNE